MSEQAFSKARSHFKRWPFEEMMRVTMVEEYRDEDVWTWNGYYSFVKMRRYDHLYTGLLADLVERRIRQPTMRRFFIYCQLLDCWRRHRPVSDRGKGTGDGVYIA